MAILSSMPIERDRIIVRLANFQDAQAITSLCKQLGYEATVVEIQQRLNKIQSNENHVMYVATLETDKVVGWIHSHLCDLVIMPTQALILGLVVDENYRCCGIGKKLLAGVEQWANKNNCDAVMVRSNVIRQKAHKFYQKNGYKNIKQSLVFYKKLNRN
jgi:N-acetylglutamate synthase-like GNAT family acetyltransferase